MRRMVALALAAVPGWAVAQEASMGGPVACGAFVTMDSTEQLAVLSAIEPLGGEIDPEDVAASQDWARDVTKACAGKPDRTVEDAARAALGGDQ